MKISYNKKIYKKSKKLCIKFSGRQRSHWPPNRGGVPSARRAAQYRRVTDVLHVYFKRGPRGACRFRARAVCMMDFEGRARYLRGLYHAKNRSYKYTAKTAFVTKK